MYEEVIGVPMIWSWPGKVPVEAHVPEMISFYDFLPSICEATGADAPQRKLTGRSYAPVAMRQPLPKKEPWNNLVFGHLRNTEMARDKRYKLVLRDEGKGRNELYDLATDPRERTNQYENPQFSTVRERLTRELNAWRTRTS
jgi:arylsulfatase A-like enzyme